MPLRSLPVLQLSLSTQVLIGLATGLVTGVFLGEEAGWFTVAGEAFIQLLQMTVLPYVTLSLITALGRLTYDEALSLAKRGGLFLIVLWGASLLFVVLTPLAFPNWPTASFFNRALVEPPEDFDFLRLYIPANPFHALANNIVPAVVLFSVALGVALIGVPRKQALLGNLTLLVEALMRVTHFVVRFSPLGVFAVTASSVGTMEVQDLGRWVVYLAAYLPAWLVLAFWVVPMLVSMMTGLRYREILGAGREALVTAFATGNLLIVLPMLAERSKALLERTGLQSPEVHAAVDVVIPISFTIPTAGKLLSLGFVLFAGWNTKSPIPVNDYPTFLATGLLTFFGHTVAAIPFLLDLFRIPGDMFRLFLLSEVLVSHFGTLLAAIHAMALALLTARAIGRPLRMPWRRFLGHACGSVAVLLVALLGMGALFTYVVTPTYQQYQAFVEMTLLGDPAPAKIRRASDVRVFDPPTASRIETIRQKKLLRVGYLKDSLPYAFQNKGGDLVGFDIEMAHELAKDLGVSIEFIELDRGAVVEQVNGGLCDIVMSGLAFTPDLGRALAFTVPYMDETLAFIVLDHRRDEFNSRDAVHRLKAPRIGVPNVPYLVRTLQKYVPQAHIERLNSPRDFFTGTAKDLDALAYSAEAGAAWTLVYPRYTVAVPLPDRLSVPLAYPLPRGDRDWTDFVSRWIELKKKDGTVTALYDHWILGKHVSKTQRRWSVLRDVLHWKNSSE